MCRSEDLVSRLRNPNLDLDSERLVPVPLAPPHEQKIGRLNPWQPVRELRREWLSEAANEPWWAAQVLRQTIFTLCLIAASRSQFSFKGLQLPSEVDNRRAASLVSGHEAHLQPHSVPGCNPCAGHVAALARPAPQPPDFRARADAILRAAYPADRPGAPQSSSPCAGESSIPPGAVSPISRRGGRSRPPPSFGWARSPSSSPRR